ncbi:phytanoyl-CoA dioxygenase family protein [Acinetobacter haemolyticus]|uniref:phytanoyl-CoA dioxygenase family protein n=1 Tax=Acinetobacter haemolyticus TaxID=29430 RepID=UPI000F7481CA|nr:phytanoyl-CoA dioxygenase family protein [Acinetobacter haemolyticus]RSN77058.1 phytanoyl-CoA dioxygenase family protein [Acinetobacter haemolyticus]
MSLVKLSKDTKVDEIVSIIQRDGGVIIENFLTEEITKDIHQALSQQLELIPDGEDEYFAGTKTRRMSRLFARLPQMPLVAMNPTFLETAKAILQKPLSAWSGENRIELCPDIQVGVTQAIQIWPGQKAQPLHRDDTVWMWQHPVYGREARVQIMFAVTDFTEENGATRVIPASHLWDDERVPKEDETIAAEMKAGDALIWIGSTYHGGGANVSHEPRIGLTMSYDLGFLRQEENHYLSLSTETIRGFPDELKGMLGWNMSTTFVGFVEHEGKMMNPIDMLNVPDFKTTGIT